LGFARDDSGQFANCLYKKIRGICGNEVLLAESAVKTDIRSQTVDYRLEIIESRS
jgi:hypothetical protein